MQNILFIFKDKPWYFEHIKNKFSKNYKIKLFFISKEIKYSRNEIINLINKTIKINKIKKVFFDIDYTSYIYANFVTKINSSNKIAFSLDTQENIYKIKKNISAFTHFFTVEPKFVQQFQKKINCLFLPIEANERLYKKINLKKKYDILFFGESKSDRMNYLNELKKLNFKKKILINQHKKISNKRLNKLINQSKIVINFSKGIKKHSMLTYDQFKGRVLLTGLAGTFCLSENYLSSKYIFKKSFPSFSNSQEMKDKIIMLMNDKNKLKRLTKNFNKSCRKYSDKLYSKIIFNFLNQKNNYKKVNLKLDEIINILKISSKKNNLKIFNQNIKDIFIDQFSSKNYLNCLSILFISFFYLIMNLKKKKL